MSVVFFSQVNDTLCKWGSNSQQYCYNIESSMLIVKIFFLFKTSFLGEDVSHYVKKKQLSWGNGTDNM